METFNLCENRQGVLQFEEDKYPYPFKDSVVLIKELVSKLKRDFDEDVQAMLFSEGLECKLLEPGFSNWETGKIRIRIEFCPDSKDKTIQNPEDITESSPLDEIRQIHI